MGFPAEPEWMHVLLKGNPSFALAYGFVPRHVRDEYSSEHIPSLRKIEQFDQVMTESGLWKGKRGTREYQEQCHTKGERGSG